MPSPKSREHGFYYGHPQNLFWRVMAAVFEVPVPATISDKTEFLLENRIAIWDVLKSCDISGADDNSIKNPVCNDMSGILSNSEISSVFTAGIKATKLYTRHCYDKTPIMPSYLPSTSPANRKYYNFDRLVDAYRAVLAAVTQT